MQTQNRRRIRTFTLLAALAAAGAALGGCELLLPAKVLCYPEPLAGCLARHHPPAMPPVLDSNRR